MSCNRKAVSAERADFEAAIASDRTISPESRVLEKPVSSAIAERSTLGKLSSSSG